MDSTDRHESASFSAYLPCPQEARTTLIESGTITSPTPSHAHENAVCELLQQLRTYLKDKEYKAYAAPFLARLYEQEENDPESILTVIESDIAIICDPSMIVGPVYNGVPDMVIRVVSPSVQHYDRIVELNLHQQAGVREFWIVSPEEKAVMTFLLDEGQLVPHNTFGQQDIAKVNILEDCHIELSRVFSDWQD